MTPEKIRDIFVYHSPSAENLAKHGQIREYMIATTVTIAEMIPESRERSLFITQMQQAQMMANAAIAIHSNR